METFLLNQNETTSRKRIALQTQEGISVFEIDSILKCSAESNYTCVYFTNGKKLLFSKTLKDFEEQLSNNNFFRIHQSHLINLLHVESVQMLDGGYVHLKQGHKVEISRRRKAEFLQKLKKG